jgi:ParB family transcriptional regulator, chromosome partitioning protein
MPNMRKLKIDKIILGDRRRQLVQEKVDEIAEGMKKIGQLAPIGVYILDYGHHRLAAAKQLGWKEIDVVFLTGDEIDRKMAEIAENLHRAELSAIERADQVAEWVRLVRQREELEVAAKEEKPKRRRGRPKGGTNKPKDNRGKSAQVAQKIAAIVPEAKSAAVAAEFGDNQSALLQIAAAPPEQQADKVAEVVATREEKKAQTRPHGMVADFDQAIAMLERCATCDAESFVSSATHDTQLGKLACFQQRQQPSCKTAPIALQSHQTLAVRLQNYRRRASTTTAAPFPNLVPHSARTLGLREVRTSAGDLDAHPQRKRPRCDVTRVRGQRTLFAP